MRTHMAGRPKEINPTGCLKRLDAFVPVSVTERFEREARVFMLLRWLRKARKDLLMKTKRLFLVCIASLAFVSCGGDDNDAPDVTEDSIQKAICDALEFVEQAYEADCP